MKNKDVTKMTKIDIKYKNDEDARNKFLDLIIKFLIYNNTLVGEIINENISESRDRNG